MQLRPMAESDLDAVAAIEIAATEFPWSMTQFAASFQGANHCEVLVDSGVVLGFAIFSLVLDEVTLLNIAVYPDAQGRGCGRYLLEQGLIRQKSLGAVSCFLEVRASNNNAQALYQSLGFYVVGERKNYYPARKGRENALVMSRGLNERLSVSI